MAILITGGAGYIGSHTCVELLNAGYEVIVLDSLSNSKAESLKRVKEITGKELKFYKTDLLNRRELEMVFIENHIDTVIHIAGLKAVSESIKVPLRYYHNNIIGTLILCEVMQNMALRKLYLVLRLRSMVYPSVCQFPKIFRLEQLIPMDEQN
ncbi:UDP-glucose 4-epimerase [Anoxybacillus sp. BCO1]|nr:UDP-glucose 4-epimerase [Anoxybacillus sp. BCO1]